MGRHTELKLKILPLKSKNAKYSAWKQKKVFKEPKLQIFGSIKGYGKGYGKTYQYYVPKIYQYKAKKIAKLH